MALVIHWRNNLSLHGTPLSPRLTSAQQRIRPYIALHNAQLITTQSIIDNTFVPYSSINDAASHRRGRRGQQDGCIRAAKRSLWFDTLHTVESPSDASALESEHVKLVLKQKHVAMLLFRIVLGALCVVLHVIMPLALILVNLHRTSFDRATHDQRDRTAVENSGSFDGPDSVSQDLLYSATLFPGPLKLFVPENISNKKSPLIQRYLLCTLRSYPVMMLRGQNPPFIHPHLLFEDSGDLRCRQRIKTGPLAVCNELLQMFTMKNRDNVLQIWRAIRMEQERLLMGVCCTIFGKEMSYDLNQTLAALQAIAIYFILRIFEKNENATNFDVPLVQTMLHFSTVACRADEIYGKQTRNQNGVMPHYPTSKLTYANLLEYNLKNDGSLDFWLSDIDEFGNFVMAAASVQE
ncbi:hypothetical protein TSTA_079500 [Talaromyces stipitatus ATCC 10500]|uniref:Uncharacterized protein n=1 Tax=Talaromyces stipitatus (strain ATCC 10500 / CBS 375.48 / QM 6759 / NRRL 1006) TaxID=441959 RepID=B8LWW2_TALSN|nr:uncharacterized protein TSTA_079500 [Talaromyces stipitatus ATCC 10500]EED24595.1 hypothetical protein TSTA_079500 [Talaromyces stipitatus ATCC 10500]